VWTGGDYLDRTITITVSFDAETHVLTGARVSRDDGCLWRRIVFDAPGDEKAKRLLAPGDGQPDAVYTARQLSQQGFTTYEDTQAVQITAEP
jgi:hypothetical protein